MTSQLARRAQAALDELAHLLDTLLGVDVGELAERAAIPATYDGFPASTLGGGRGGTGDPLGERIAAELSPGTDDDGTPVGTAGGGRRHDPVGEHARTMVRALEEAAGFARAAAAAAARARFVPSTERPAERPQAEGCVNCARYDVFELAVKAGRCDACYQFLRRSGARQLERPERLVVADQPGHRPRTRSS